jgi:tRNA threonylcarbamoyladenosine biosynthesis protein TsaB
MRILALDTSSEFCSVALWQDGEMLSRIELVGQKHSEVLMQMLDELLRTTEVKLAQLDGIAFGAGPGSFTGVRIACGVAQGLALGADVPVLGISTLLALAQASEHNKVITALDARMGEVYFAAYQKQSGQWHTVHEPTLCLPQAAPSLEGNGWAGVGSGFAAHGAALAMRYAGQIEQMSASLMPQASAMAQLAAPIFATGQGIDAALAMPIYLRDKVALKSCER